MRDEESIRRAFASLEVNDDFSEAVVLLQDQSRLTFRHRVGERSAAATGPAERAQADHQAIQILARLARFRLNAKHLEIEFADGSRWELLFAQRPKGTEPSR